MTAPRLPFLYPNLMRAIRTCEPSTYRSIRNPSYNRPFHATRSHSQEAYHRRYGPAVESSLPPPTRPKGESSSEQNPKPAAAEDDRDNIPAEQLQSQDSAHKHIPETPYQGEIEKEAQSHENAALDDSHTHDESEPELDSHASEEFPSIPTEHVKEERHILNPLNENPLEDVLHMPSPSSNLTTTEAFPSGSRPPHLAPAPYVHHFDSYSLVRDLSKGGFSDEQSVTIMKAVRNILHGNLDIARQSLTSKSDVENETYLFKAACSELQSSLQIARNSEIQQQRASRTHLQHEADILSQRLNQELSGLKDDIKGMFNDHKMSTREQQRSIDTLVQELNYKITVSLNSDGKSEIEGLRWILTRRAAMAIAISAFMIIIFLKYYSVRRAQEAAEKQKETPAKELTEKRVIQESVSPPTITPMSEMIMSESLG